MQKNKLQKVKYKKRGFTLIETLVAISILLMAVIGPLTTASRGLSSAGLAKERIAAFYLAQEGVELVRNQRDRNTIAGFDWMEGLNTCFGTNGCMIDPTNVTPPVTACTGSCDVLKQSSASDLYGYGAGWVNSPFTRTIKMTNINSQEVSLSVEISWTSGTSVKNLVIEEHLLNWQ